MPLEQTLRDNPLKQYTINQSVVWYDADNDVFCLASANSGDCGDSFGSYIELCEAVAEES